MDRKLSRTIVLELIRPIVLMGSLVERLLGFVFRPSRVRSSHERDRRFGLEIHKNLPFLFHEYDAQISSDTTLEYPRPFDYAVTIVIVDSMLLRFIQGRGELRIQVASKSHAEDWGELPFVLRKLGWRPEGAGPPGSFSSLRDAAIALKPHMDVLLNAYLDENYAGIASQVSDAREQDRVEARRLSADLNRKLFG